jgi:TPR repeat protein
MRSLTAVMILASGLWSLALADPSSVQTLDALRAKAEQGDSAAQSSLGGRYEIGLGVRAMAEFG